MPPKGASTRKKAVRTARTVRKTPPSKTVAAPAAETSPPEAAAAPAAEIGSPETPAVAEAAAAADTTTFPAAVNTELPPAETCRDAAALETVAAPEPAPEVTSNAGAAAEEAAVVADAAPETAVSEPVEAPDSAAEVAESAAKRPGKRIVRKVRKVTRRVPVTRTRSAVAMENEGKGGDGEEGQETTARATAEQEGNPSGAEAAVSMSANEERGETGPMATTEQEGNPSSAEAAVPISLNEDKGGNGEERQETKPMATTEQEGNPSSAEAAVSVWGEQIGPASDPDQPSAPDNTTSNVEAAVAAAAAAASAVGASPLVESKKRIRKVKVRVPVKRMVKKVKVSQKDEQMEEADVGTITEKLNGQDSDVNPDESSKSKDPGVEVEASTASNAAPHMLMQEDVIPDLGENCSWHGGTGENVGGEEGKGEDVGTSSGSAGDVLAGATERQKRRKTEIFIGGLDRDAKEEDIRKVFGKVGEIVEIRLMMDGKTGKNKGYAFLRYATAAQAKQAVKEFTKVEVCGKQCGAAALEGNDTIFLGNIDKKWKKDDVVKLLNEIGIQKIDTVTIMPDSKNADCNRGFAFLELETNRDAQIAFKKLQKKDVFGKGQNIKVAWAEPLNDPDEEEMQKVKSVYAEGIPTSWDEQKVRECFKKFGQIERVVLSRNMQSAKRKDFAFVNFTTREAALSCIESFDKEEVTDKGSKVSLAKPAPKGKQNKARSKSGNKDSSNEKPKAVQRETKVTVSSKTQSLKGPHGIVSVDNTPATQALLHVLRDQASWKQGQAGYPIGETKVTVSSKTQSLKGPHGIVGVNNTSATQALLHVLREQASWKQGQAGYPIGTTNPGYRLASHGGKRPLSALGDDAVYSDPRGHPHVRLDSAYPVTSTSYGSLSHNMSSASVPHYQQQNVRYGTGSIYGEADVSRTFQTRPGNAPHGSSLYSR